MISNLAGQSLAIAAGLALSASAAYAHHSIAGVYDSSRRATIQGVVKQFHFVNPHPFVIVDVTNDSGKTAEWRLEMDNRFELAAIGFTDETLKSGDRVIVSGSLARKQSNSLYILRLDRQSDGFSYEQVGSSPRVNRRPQ